MRRPARRPLRPGAAPAALFLLGAVLAAFPGTSRGAPPGASERPALDAARTERALGLLETNLRRMAEAKRAERIAGGYALGGLAVASGVAGAVVLAADLGDDPGKTGGLLLGLGAVSGGVSLFDFRVASGAERLYLDFHDAPHDTDEEKARLLAWGDERFAQLVARRKRFRVMSGVASMLLGASTLLWYKGETRHRVAAVVVPALGGFFTLVGESDEERLYHEYRWSLTALDLEH
jgi:hypothetical protein